MLRALTEAGVEPDLMVGASAGAINAFCFAQHPTTEGLDRLQRLWRRMHRKAAFPLDAVQVMAGLAGMRDGLVPPGRLRSPRRGRPRPWSRHPRRRHRPDLLRQ